MPPADYFLSRHSGLGGLLSNRWSQTSPLDVGEIDIGRKITGRTATLEVGLASSTPATLEQDRRRLVEVLAPDERLLTVQITGLDGIIREGRASCIRPPMLDSGQRLQSILETRFQLRFPDPRFYGLDIHTVEVMGASMSDQGFTIPFPIPFDIGGVSWGGTQTVEYEGSWAVQPEVRATGPLSQFSILNATTGKRLRFASGFVLGMGQVWHFRPQASRTVTIEDPDGSENNGIHTIDTDSDLSEFTLEHGSNAIVISGAGQSGLSDVVMSWTDVYQSI